MGCPPNIRLTDGSLNYNHRALNYNQVIRMGCPPSIRLTDGSTMLHRAASSCRDKNVAVLLEGRADPRQLSRFRQVRDHG